MYHSWKETQWSYPFIPSQQTNNDTQPTKSFFFGENTTGKTPQLPHTMSSGPIVAHPSPGAGPGRPSDARRKFLNEELSVPMVSNFFSIERYYDAADKVYESFQSAFTEDKLDDAYVYGRRYCTFCLEAIPTHNYFTADRYKHLQTKHRPQVDFVLTTLAKVADKMDEEELEKQALAWEQAQREAEEQAKRNKEEYEALQKRAYQFTSSSSISSSIFALTCTCAFLCVILTTTTGGVHTPIAFFSRSKW